MADSTYYALVGISFGFVLFIVAVILSEMYENQKKKYEKKKFEKFDGHLGYLIYSNMSRWIRTDIDNMQRKIDETNSGSPVQEQKTEQSKPEITPQDRQEQIQTSTLKKQDEKRQQKEQATAIKRYWESMQPELNIFSQSSEDTAKKAAGMKILEISEENFSLEHLKQQYQHVLKDYIQPLQESEADRAQKKKVLEAVFQELYGWAI